MLQKSPDKMTPAFLDARKLHCPMPSVHLRMALDTLEPNQTLEMLAIGETAFSNAKTLLAMLHYPEPEILLKDATTGEWKILIYPKKY
ncbi:sulfurtransferase TusA family protein [Acetobacteraceae bacterium]|nr:sulfurtransferase TusA family protein [Acetobacteraceae bacterium]